LLVALLNSFLNCFFVIIACLLLFCVQGIAADDVDSLLEIFEQGSCLILLYAIIQRESYDLRRCCR